MRHQCFHYFVIGNSICENMAEETREKMERDAKVDIFNLRGDVVNYAFAATHSSGASTSVSEEVMIRKFSAS